MMGRMKTQNGSETASQGDGFREIIGGEGDKLMALDRKVS